MTQSEKLDALVKRAIEHGFGVIRYYEVKERSGWLDGKQQTEPYILQGYNAGKVFEREIAYQVVIFNHDFAKALWGDEPCLEIMRPAPTDVHPRAVSMEKLWQWEYHLQQAVIAPNPIDYMYKEVFGK